MIFKLSIKFFSFNLLNLLQTSQGVIKKRQGWLIRLQSEAGKSGWGEVSPFKSSEQKICAQILRDLGNTPSRYQLEQTITKGPGVISFGFGAALGEIDSLIGNEATQKGLKGPSSAILLPTNESLLLKTLDSIISQKANSQEELTFKWKVAHHSNERELSLLQEILSMLPSNSKLRIDANGGWDRKRANYWAAKLQSEPRLEWLEQPLTPKDVYGLKKLATNIPVALDESLVHDPSLRQTWRSWQIRRPLIDGDPRILLKELKNKNGYRVISTAFETGIGMRWVEHLAVLQQKSQTPTKPGLAPGWRPNTPLFSSDPHNVWEAV